MRVRRYDIVRVKRTHMHYNKSYGDGIVIGIATNGKIRVRWQNRPNGNWVEDSLRLFRRIR